MKEEDKILEEVTAKEYEYGFVTNIESDKVKKGLNESIIRLISQKKEEPEWLLKWRLNAFNKWR